MIAATISLAVLCSGLPSSARAPSGQSPGAEESCTVCHGKEQMALAESVHARQGFTCVSCHGGNAQASAAHEAHAGDFRPLTDPLASVASCADCHSDVERMRVAGLRTDQLALYRTSRHGSVLFETGDPDVATCTDCHSSHGILHAADPSSSVHPRNQAATCGACHADAALMGRYELRADAPDLYERSVHGIAVAEGRLASPGCTDCHGHHGALPPRVDEAEQVCGHCHSVVQEYYERSPHFRLEPIVQCVTCHGNHLVLPPAGTAFLGDGPGSCSACHAAPDSPAREVAAGLHADLAQFQERIESSAQAARRAGRRGLYLDQELGYLPEARGVLALARSLTHAVSREDLDDLLNRGQGMLGQTEDSLTKLRRIDRDRWIFTAVFFALSVALAIMLLMYAREIRGAGRAPARGSGGSRRPGNAR